MPIQLPPLRERGTDILLLAEHFLVEAAAAYRLAVRTLTPAARQALLDHAWPGNVRELANTMERVALLSEGEAITVEELGLPDSGPDARAASPAGAPSGIRGSVERFERERLLDALERAGWNVARAAAELAIPRNTLRYRIAKHGLKPPEGSGRRGWRGEPAPAGPATGQGAPPDSATPSTAGDAASRPRSLVRVTVLRVAVEAPGDIPPSWEVARRLDLIADKVESFGGVVIARAASSLDAAFGLAPTEDAPSRAANAALAIQRLAEQALPGTRELHARIAIHALPCAVVTADGAPQPSPESRQEIGEQLDHLVAQADPGTIVVSEAAASLLQRRFTLEPHGDPADAE